MDEPEIHPLDRDYSDDAAAPTKSPISSSIDYHDRLRRFGVIVFALGFVGLFVAAVFLSNAKGNTSAESLASVLHQLAMVVILFGGVMVFVAYRWPQISQLMNPSAVDMKRRVRRPFLNLAIGNVVVYVLIVGATSLVSNPPSYGFVPTLVGGSLTAAVGLFITMIVWHRGMLRGYAIGALAALTVNGFSLMMMMANGFWGGNSTVVVSGHLAVILISGLISGGYVALIEGYRAKRQITAGSVGFRDSQPVD